MGKAEDDARSGIQFTQGQILETIHGSSIIGPDFDAAIEVDIGCAEEISPSDGVQ
ncbi:MAG: hypothetical protein LAP21_28380 [Acidobacteriia bacterium]|nr:hypothetical protein [Terriglobia bacterium]